MRRKQVIQGYWLVWGCWLMMGLALAGCGRTTPEATPTVPPTRTPLPTFTPTAVQSMETPPATTPVVPSEAPAVEATEAVPLSTATATPAQESALAACAVEPNLDLAGYSNLEQVMGCALAAASNEAVAINEFGTGPDYDRFMVWFSTTQEIYVLFPDQTWQTYPDTWQEGVDPEIMCNPLGGPEASPPLPRRGFGKLWCTVQEIQGAMGAIEREERLCQHVVTQEFEKGRMVACFEDATIRYFRILRDQTWDVTLLQ